MEELERNTNRVAFDAERHWRTYRAGRKAKKSGIQEDFLEWRQCTSDACLLGLYTSFLKSAPQAVLQIYVLLEHQEWTFWNVPSALTSLVFLATAVPSYDRDLQLYLSQGKSFSWIGFILQTLWRFTTITARIVAMVFLARCSVLASVLEVLFERPAFTDSLQDYAQENNAGPPRPESLGFSTYLRPGDEAVATCLLRKTSPGQTATLAWLKDGRPLPTSTDRLIVMKPSQNSLTLAIRDVLVDDIGNYTCVADGPDGRVETIVPLVLHARLDAASVPKPQSLGFPPSLGLGDLAIASCFVKAGARNSQKLTLSWTKDGRELVSDERIEVHTTSGSGGTMLSIRNLQPDDVGNYTCTVRSPEGSQDVTVPLLVFGLPPRIRPFAAQEDLSLGDSTVLTCALRRGSRGPHDIVWLMGDGSAVSEEGRGGRVSVHRQSDVMSILALTDIAYEDAGSNYTCVASNVHGSDRRTAVLQVS
ncbi:hypothetical protein V5799_019435, partial [Amblyomma americanum]